MDETSDALKRQHNEVLVQLRRQHAEVIDRLNTAAYYERRSRWVVGTVVVTVVVTLVLLKILEAF